MRQAMVRAEVGDDVYGEDPTVNRLQERVAERLGKPAALFVPSGTMANQICLRVLSSPGDEVICEQGTHFLHFEAGALPILSGIQARALPGKHGVITLEQIREAIRPSAYYYPRTKVIALENTHNLAGGTLFPIDEAERIGAFCRENGLFLHLDGARLWNASVASGIPLERLAAPFDTVAVSLSKGLGAPAGAVVAGSTASIEEARHVRKQLGGGMRQIGILAAAGLYALDNNIDRLAEDHEKARRFAEIIAGSPAVEIELDTVQTNIVVFKIRSGEKAQRIAEKLKEQGVLISAISLQELRAVTHLDVSRKDVERAARLLEKMLVH